MTLLNQEVGAPSPVELRKASLQKKILSNQLKFDVANLRWWYKCGPKLRMCLAKLSSSTVLLGQSKCKEFRTIYIILGKLHCPLQQDRGYQRSVTWAPEHGISCTDSVAVATGRKAPHQIRHGDLELSCCARCSRWMVHHFGSQQRCFALIFFGRKFLPDRRNWSTLTVMLAHAWNCRLAPVSKNTLVLGAAAAWASPPPYAGRRVQSIPERSFLSDMERQLPM